MFVRSGRLGWVLAALMLMLAACGNQAPAQDAVVVPDATGGERQTTASGLQYIIYEEGTGDQAQAGDTVSVHYTGMLEDGTVFDTSEGGEPIGFVLGQGNVIPGWDEGIALLREGSRARLIIPPDLGYGAQDYGPIPGNSTLIFDVELVSVE